MKKKLLLLLIVAMTFSLMLVGCGSDDDYEDADMEYEDEEVISVAGTEWLLVSMTDQDVEVPAEDIEETFGELVYEFREDGLLIAYASISGEESEATWTQEGDRIDVVTEGVESFYTIEEDVMFTKNEGVMLVFKLQ